MRKGSQEIARAAAHVEHCCSLSEIWLQGFEHKGVLKGRETVVSGMIFSGLEAGILCLSFLGVLGEVNRMYNTPKWGERERGRDRVNVDAWTAAEQE